MMFTIQAVPQDVGSLPAYPCFLILGTSLRCRSTHWAARARSRTVVEVLQRSMRSMLEYTGLVTLLKRLLDRISCLHKRIEQWRDRRICARFYLMSYH